MEKVEEMKMVYQQIQEVNQKIDCMTEENYQKLHAYSKELFDLKLRLQELEKISYLEREPDISGEEIDLYLKNVYEPKESADKLSYLITLHGSKEKVGEIEVRFYLYPKEEYLGNLSAGIEEAHRGNRYAKKAFYLLRDTLLEKGLVKPVFTVLVTNGSSISSLEAIGAERVGTNYDTEDPYHIYEYDLEKENFIKK